MAASKIDLSAPEYYINRELSWIEFNRRVLEEAEDTSNPLLERLKFLAIFSSNLDEFFMVRVAGLKEQMDAGVVNLANDGMSAQDQLIAIRQRLLPLIQKQSALLTRDVLPALAQEGVVIHPFSQLNARDRNYLEEYFLQKIFPLLTPLAIDSGHPFPQVLNRSLNLLFVVEDHRADDEKRAAVLQLPSVLSRFIPLKRRTGYHFVLMEEVIQAYSDELFPGLSVLESYAFRVSRDADIAIAEDEASDLLTEMEEQVRQRRWGAAVRLEVDERTPEHLRELLMNLLDLTKEDVYAVNGPRNITDFMLLTSIDARSLKFPSYSTRTLARFQVESAGANAAASAALIFHTIRQQDVFIHHPFDSFTNHTVRFMNAAAEDPAVLAIKITLYRAGGKSPVVEALMKAAQNGKQVTAFVELKARFDEENNILWAKELERAGVHVVYGLVGLKTHAKIAMVVRKEEEEKIRTYVHLSTGNYNQTTARIYTDMAYFTAREDFAQDAINLFNYLTGYSQCKDWKRFAVAPITLRETLLDLIRRETELHSNDNPGEIVAKLNALVDETMIKALYRASQKGVKIRLLVRGVCCLRPGLPGVSENIEVRSIVGRFLEHSRILYFRNGGKEEIYLSSADWMPRNLYRRVETLFPVLEASAVRQIKHILSVYWSDTAKARRLNPEGVYTHIRPAPGEEAFNAQQHFLNELKMKDAELSAVINSFIRHAPNGLLISEDSNAGSPHNTPQRSVATPVAVRVIPAAHTHHADDTNGNASNESAALEHSTRAEHTSKASTALSSSDISNGSPSAHRSKEQSLAQSNSSKPNRATSTSTTNTSTKSAAKQATKKPTSKARQ
jgi:polyphosphate kinase